MSDAKNWQWDALAALHRSIKNGIVARGHNDWGFGPKEQAASSGPSTVAVAATTPTLASFCSSAELDKIGRVSHLLAGFCGKDRKGQPICYERPDPANITAILNKWGPDQCTRCHIATCECLKALQFEAGVERFDEVIDLSNFGLQTLWHIPALSNFAEKFLFDQRFYPENLDQVFLVNPTISMRIIWAGFQHLIGDDVKNRLHFVTQEEANRQLGVTWDQVPVEYGGTVENGLMHLPEVLRAFEHRDPTLAFGYGKHKTLLPNDRVNDRVQQENSDRWKITAEEVTGRWRATAATSLVVSTTRLHDYYATVKSSMREYLATDSSSLLPPRFEAYVAL